MVDLEVLVRQKAVIAKVGMDAHWRGAIVVANALREAGMEVVYVGHTTSEAIANTVLQEDPIILGVSSLSGNHMAEMPKLLQVLADRDVTDVGVVIGGSIPSHDAAELRALGVDGVYPTGTPLSEVVTSIADIVSGIYDRRRQAADAPPLGGGQ